MSKNKKVIHIKDKAKHLLAIDISVSCWEKAGDQPIDQRNEIIEIGVVDIDLKKLEIVKSKSLLIKPAKATISNFCTKITSITQEMVEKEPSFKEACKSLVDDFKSKEKLWVSWGEYDRRQFRKQCREDEVSYPFGAGHWNLKSLFTILQGVDGDYNLLKALEHYNIKFDGHYHRGIDNATNMAFLIIDMQKRLRLSNKYRFNSRAFEALSTLSFG